MDLTTKRRTAYDIASLIGNEDGNDDDSKEQTTAGEGKAILSVMEDSYESNL